MNISILRGKALTYITIMFLMSADPRFKNVTFVYISPDQADDPEILTLFQQTPTRFKIDPDKADNLERAAEIIVRKVKDKTPRCLSALYRSEEEIVTPGPPVSLVHPG